MTPHLPAEGISLTHDFGKSKYYQVTCMCGISDDIINFAVESDEFGEIIINTWTIQKTDWWSDRFNMYQLNANKWYYDIAYTLLKWMNALYHRVKLTKNIWIDGYVRYDSTTIMNKQQALNYAETLKQAINDIEMYEKK